MVRYQVSGGSIRGAKFIRVIRGHNRGGALIPHHELGSHVVQHQGCGDFTVKKAGRYWIEITLGGLGIGGSPYVIDFSPDPAEEVKPSVLSFARVQQTVKSTCFVGR